MKVLTALLIFLAVAQAKQNEAWEANPPEVRQWYRNLMQPDNPYQSCCGEADAYWADSFEVTKDGLYIAIVTDPRDIQGRPTVTMGTKVVVPNHKLKYDDGNPTGHGVIFMRYDPENDSYYVLCYVVPGGV